MNFVVFCALLLHEVLCGPPDGSLQLTGGTLVTEPTAQITDAPSSATRITQSGNQDEIVVTEPGVVLISGGTSIQYNSSTQSFEAVPNQQSSVKSSSATVIALGQGTTTTVEGKAVVSAAGPNDPTGVAQPGNDNPAVTIY